MQELPEFLLNQQAMTDAVLRECLHAFLARGRFKSNHLSCPVVGTSIAICMPMTHWAVVIYLGIILAGCAAVGIADSFSPKEIAARLRIARCALTFTQDVVVRDGKNLPLYARLTQASSHPIIVLPASEKLQVRLFLLMNTFAISRLMVIHGSGCPMLQCTVVSFVNCVCSPALAHAASGYVGK